MTNSGIGNTGTIYIGHSQGGLISRRLGQEQPGVVGGVITIGTPNLGAPLLSNGTNAIMTAFGGMFGMGAFQLCFAHYNGALCDLTRQASNNILTPLLQFSLSNAVPASADLTPNSTFLVTSQHGFESFRRSSIAVNARAPWRFMRLVGDMVGGCDASGYCKGRDYARRTEIAYKAISGCSFFASFFHRLLGVGAACGATRDAMKGMDNAFNYLIANKGASDAIVPVVSQHYPGNLGYYAAGRFYIDDGDSHVGETRSRWTFEALKNQALPNVAVP